MCKMEQYDVQNTSLGTMWAQNEAPNKEKKRPIEQIILRSSDKASRFLLSQYLQTEVS